MKITMTQKFTALTTVVVFGLVVLFFSSTTASAAHCIGVSHSPAEAGQPCSSFPGNGGPVVSPSALNNPLSVGSIEELLVALLTVVQVIAVPIIVFFIIYSGFLYVTARGNAEQTQKATRSLMYAVIGGVIVVGAVVLATIVENLVGSFQ